MSYYGGTITTYTTGYLTLQHWHGEASYSNGLQVYLPFNWNLEEASIPYPGRTYNLGVYPAGTEVLLSLRNPNSGNNYTTNAWFQDGQPLGGWLISWEDGGGNDWNDAYTLISSGLPYAGYAEILVRL